MLCNAESGGDTARGIARIEAARMAMAADSAKGGRIARMRGTKPVQLPYIIETLNPENSAFLVNWEMNVKTIIIGRISSCIAPKDFVLRC